MSVITMEISCNYSKKILSFFFSSNENNFHLKYPDSVANKNSRKLNRMGFTDILLHLWQFWHSSWTFTKLATSTFLIYVQHSNLWSTVYKNYGDQAACFHISFYLNRSLWRTEYLRSTKLYCCCALLKILLKSRKTTWRTTTSELKTYSVSQTSTIVTNRYKQNITTQILKTCFSS